VSTARGLGKQSEHAEDKRFSLQIVGFGVARGGIDPLPGVGQALEAREAAVHPAMTIKAARQPSVDGVDKSAKRSWVGARKSVAKRMQRVGIDRGKSFELVKRPLA